MKFIELKENETLEMVEVYSHVMFPGLNKEKNPEEYMARYDESSEYGRIKTKVFTDGKIDTEGDEFVEDIYEFYIGENKYPYNVDVLKGKNISFKDYSYVITYLIANEFTSVGNVRGWFDVIKEVTVYLKNPKDIKSLINAKRAIKEIAKNNQSVDRSSIYGTILSKGVGLKTFETQEIADNVYTLTKKK